MKKQPHIGIMGYGMVGGAVGAWFTGAAKYSPHRFRPVIFLALSIIADRS